MRYAPLSKTPVSATFDTIGKLRRIPLGALFGLTVAGGIRFLWPDESPEGWLEAPFALFCAGCGLFVERAIHYGLGWMVDTRLHHLAAWYAARIEMRKLRRYEKAGVLNQADVRRIAARIARRDVAGGPGPKRGPRGPSKPRSKSVTPSPAPGQEPGGP